MIYVYVTGDNNTPDDIDKEFQIKLILHWASFTGDSQKNALNGDSIQEYSDLLDMVEGDVTDLAKDYSSRASATKFTFGLRKIKKLKAIIHWSKDHRLELMEYHFHTSFVF